MRTKLSLVAASVSVALACATGASAAPPAPEPGKPNCEGLFIAALAQLGKNQLDEQRARGLGQLAKFYSVHGFPTTVQQLHQDAKDFCSLHP